MKRFKIASIAIVLMMTLLAVQPTWLLAGEHGGTDIKEHGGGSMGGDNAATLMEAASILKATHPDLAAKLEKMAEEQK